MGSPTSGTHGGSKNDGINSHGFKMPFGGESISQIPPLKNPPNPLPRQQSNVSQSNKKNEQKGIRQKEYDANGQIIKKPRAKRAAKPIEEIEINFRVRTLAEKALVRSQNAGFPDTPPASDHEGDAENENEEEEKGEQV